MLVEEKMKLIKSRPGRLPVMLFVHIAQRYRIGEQRRQKFHALAARLLIQSNRHGLDGAKILAVAERMHRSGKRRSRLAPGALGRQGAIVIHVFLVSRWQTHGKSKTPRDHKRG